MSKNIIRSALTIILIISILLSFLPIVSADIPPTPITLQNTTGVEWINYTWSNGTLGNITNSYNVSFNASWTNGSSNEYINVTVGTGNWGNITVWAYNTSVSGNLSNDNVTDQIQLANWLTGWDYRKIINITGQAGADEYYTINFSIGNASGGDFNLSGNSINFPADIRFTDDDGDTFLNYWFENISANPIDIWVNVSDNLSSNQYIYCYYGNSEVSTTSDGVTTFQFFDTFDMLEDEGNPTLTTAAWGDSVLVNGTYYMFYADGSGVGGDIIRVNTTDFLTYNDPEVVNTSADAPAILKDLDGITPVKYDGKYWMAYTKGATSGIFVASAETIEGAWTTDSKIIDMGAGGTWDDAGVYTPSFVKNASLYYIYYQGNDGSGVWDIGYATATTPDGVWTKHAGNPVLSPTGAAWDNDYVIDPIIRKFDTTYYLLYTGRNGANTDDNGYATAPSINGSWTKYASNPILEGEGGEWDVYVTYPNVFKIGDLFYQPYDGHDGIVFAKKGLATASSMTGTWKKAVGKWSVGISPTVSSSELLLNASGEFIKSNTSFEYKAMKARVKFAGVGADNSFQYFGFQPSSGGSILNEEMIFTYDTPDMKAWSGDADTTESTSVYDVAYLGTYQLYEILWESGQANFTIDEDLKDSDTTSVLDSAQPVSFVDYDTNADLYVDWMLVRKYINPEPAFLDAGDEEELPPGGVSFVPPTPVNLQNTTGDTWVNATWDNGTLGNITNTYNISFNGSWTNGSSNEYINVTITSGGWGNITIWAYNTSGESLSAASVSDNIRALTDTSFSVSLPLGYTYALWDMPNSTGQYVNPAGQTSSIPFYNVTHTGSAEHIQLLIKLNTTLATVTVTIDTDNDPAGGKTLTTNPQDFGEINTGDSLDLWIWSSFDHTLTITTNRTLNMSVQA